MKVVQPIRDLDLIKEIAQFLKEKNERDYVLFAIGIYTGLRIADMLKLKVADVKDKTHIEIHEGKTKKLKRIKLSPDLNRILKGYIAGKEDKEYLFKSRQGNGGPISRERAYAILKEAANEFRLKNIGCHSMRKTFGYFMYESTGHDVALLQELFNHSSPEITLRYIGINQDSHDKAIDTLKFL
ncbi:site-specific integrase [Lysinibacillus boronitolerans]|uniref:site-specific integrase n=1 Tax=Lysinibacillus boronitolerans TaxID=309788 RepID=UPI00031AC695|nr:site-specific integrase [Lysinibacillus boronitolerans]